MSFNPEPSGKGADNGSKSAPRFINNSSIPYYADAPGGAARGLVLALRHAQSSDDEEDLFASSSDES